MESRAGPRPRPIRPLPRASPNRERPQIWGTKIVFIFYFILFYIYIYIYKLGDRDRDRDKSNLRRPKELSNARDRDKLNLNK